MSPSLWTQVLGVSVRTWACVVISLLFCFRVYRNFGCLKQELEILADSHVKLQQTFVNSKLKSSLVSISSDESADNIYWSKKGAKARDDAIILYNRVPKTGSTSFARLTLDLCTINGFSSIYVNISHCERVLSLANQMKFITNITNWDEAKPAVYHGHMPFIDFTRFGIKKRPIYINLIREPLDRFMSYYYFLRFGDDFRPDKIRRRSGNNETFDECVARGGRSCRPEKLWLQVPYFCGHHPACRRAGSEWALEEAKRNLFHHYLVVGITEDFLSFLSVLEVALPRFYRGATALFEKGRNTQLRKTSKKLPPLPETVKKIKESNIYRLERKFYDFAVEQFRIIKYEILNDRLKEGDKFLFQNIEPKTV
ncbi:hypothetical protein RRG08_033914 [Elysia crispata]|uniref:Heparan sulfate 2-O-sulfotransferase n=1 Tax=Elysia crispata TaxID=231223 RepID=A0AAE1B9E1_9GAST|nr:hypothetical protein RRG08_033914 [Elysia crispata]